MVSKDGNLVRSLYRIILKQGRKIDTLEDGKLLLQRPFDKDAWIAKSGSPTFFNEDTSTNLTLPCPPGKGPITRSWLRKASRASFQNTDQKHITPAFDAIRILDEQMYLASKTSSAVTRDVMISTIAMYVGSQAELDPLYEAEEDEVKYYYSYRIQIHNMRYVFYILLKVLQPR
jgi:hypothetical protein